MVSHAVLAAKKTEQDDHSKFETSLLYVEFKPARATQLS